MHHSHYILLDDGTKYRYDRIEDQLSAIIDVVSKGQGGQEFKSIKTSIEYISKTFDQIF